MYQLTRLVAVACATCVLLAGGAALAANRHAGSPKSKKTSNVIVALEEESIGGEDLPSPNPATSPSPAAGAADENPNPQGWTGVKSSASTPAASASPGAPASAPTSGANAGDEAQPSDAAAQSSPAAEATEVPPAMDIGSLIPTRAVSDSSLKPLIEKAPNPALAASLRITEKARVDIEQGHADDAIRSLAYAVSIDPGNSYAYFYLGRAYIAKKNYPQAITFFRRAEIGVGGNPAWLGETYTFEGLSYEESGKSPEAAAAYQKALAVMPGNLAARVGYTRLSAFIPAQPGAAPSTDLVQPPPAETEVPPPPSVLPPPPPPPRLSNSSDD